MKLSLLRRLLSNLDYNKHKQIINLNKFVPVFPQTTYIAPSATIAGEVYIETHCQILNNVVIRGDLNSVTIMEGAVIQENTVINTLHTIRESGELSKTIIGEGTIIMPNCSLSSCTIGKNCFIGYGTVICEGAIIESESVIAPYSVIPPSRFVDSGQLWGGNPIKFIKVLEKPEKVSLMDKRLKQEEYVDLLLKIMNQNSSADFELEKFKNQQNNK